MMNPAETFNFTTAVLDSRITLTRALNTATRVNSSGLIETVNANLPRFDYDPITKVCRGLLIEELRANKTLRSQEFNDAAWLKERSSITQDAVVAPDGTMTADKLVEDTTASNSHRTRTAALITYPSGATITNSVFVKAAERTWVNLSDGGGVNSGVFFNLVTGVFGTVQAGVLSRGAVDYGDGWWRIFYTCTLAGTASNPFINIATGSSTSTYTGDGTSGIYIWGAQGEEGALPTSYIHTTTTAVTRNADLATITGANFSSFWQASKGGVLVRALPSTVSGTRPLVQVDDASADNIIALRGNTTNPELYIRAGGSDQATIDAGTISAAAYRLAGAWAAGNAAAALNSGLAVNGAPGSIPAATQMRLGSDGTNYLNGHLQAVEYWPVRLSNAGLQNASSTAGYGGILAPVMQDATLYPQINRSFGL